jgi:hypothetical protein
MWLAPKELATDPHALPSALTENRISVLIVMPTFLALFNTDVVPCLRLIVLGGEMCSEHLVSRWASFGPYKVTTRYEFLEKMPRLSSGKIDRKKLKESPFFRQKIGLDESDRATTEAEAILFDTVTRLFPGQTIWWNADFFTDLGGNSLMAALFVSTLRQQEPRFTDLNKLQTRCRMKS